MRIRILDMLEANFMRKYEGENEEEEDDWGETTSTHVQRSQTNYPASMMQSLPYRST